jgi:hypothetical protein
MPISGVESTVNILFRIAALTITLVCVAADAFADCSPPRTAKVAFERADAVFRGWAQGVRRAPGAGASDGPGLIVVFDVSRVWKCHVGPRFVIHNSPNHSDDVYDLFEQGLEYLVFASINSPQKAARFDVPGTSYEAKACGGTTDMVWAPRYLIDLGAGRPPAVSRLLDPRKLQ